MRILIIMFIFSYTSLAISAQDGKIKVLIVDGYGNHDWQKTTKLVQGILDAAQLFTFEVSTVPVDTNSAEFKSWHPKFKNYDVVIQTCNDINNSGPLWTESVRWNFEKYVRKGGGVLVLHSANNAFADWPEYNNMIGLGWRNKDYGYAFRVNEDGSLDTIPPGQGKNTSHGAREDRVIHIISKDPIHMGMPEEWKTPSIEVYTYARGPAKNVTVLSWAEDPVEHDNWPVEWIVRYGKGRIYTSTFGHVWPNESDPVDMRCAGFQTVLVRAIQWLANQPVTYPIPVDFPTKDNISLRVLPLVNQDLLESK